MFLTKLQWNTVKQAEIFHKTHSMPSRYKIRLMYIRFPWKYKIGLFLCRSETKIRRFFWNRYSTKLKLYILKKQIEKEEKRA